MAASDGVSAPSVNTRAVCDMGLIHGNYAPPLTETLLDLVVVRVYKSKQCCIVML